MSIPAKKSVKLLAVGNPVYDTIQTPAYKIDKRVLSGCSTNAALAVTRLGGSATIVGRIGGDLKERLEREAREFGIGTVLEDAPESGGFSLMYLDDRGNRTLSLLGNAGAISRVPGDLVENCDTLLVGPILGEVPTRLIHDLRRSCKGLMACDPQGLLRSIAPNREVIHCRPDGIEETLALFDIVKPNELEARILTGIDCRIDPCRAARIIHEWGVPLVIVTLAELGSVIFDGSRMYTIPPYRTVAVDPTGCGDTYMGGFLYGYFKSGGDVRKAGCLGSAVASLMVEHVGPDFPLNRDEVNRRHEIILAEDSCLPVSQKSAGSARKLL